MIETDGFWHHKTFESVLNDLQNMWMEGICELENTSMHCTNNANNDAEMDGAEVINLCSVSQNKNEAYGEGKECAKQESQDKLKPDTTDKMEVEIWTRNSKSMTKNEEVKVAMMCWEAMNIFPEEEPHKEPEKVEKKPVEKMKKPKHEKNLSSLH